MFKFYYLETLLSVSSPFFLKNCTLKPLKVKNKKKDPKSEWDPNPQSNPIFSNVDPWSLSH